MLLNRQLDKPQVKNSFAQAARTYDSVAQLQRKVGQNLIAQLQKHHLSGTLLDVGCGTGFVSEQLITFTNCEQLLALDIALPMLETTLQKINSQKLTLLCADAEYLPLTEHSVNHIISNLALQWCENLTAVFTDFKRVLKPNGQLFFSTFGEKTLHELKTAWQKADNHSHVNQFYPADELRYFMQQTGFKQIEMQISTYHSTYESVFGLMRELKAIGAHNVTTKRSKGMTGKAKMQAMIADYETLRCDGLIPATFEIITVSARV